MKRILLILFSVLLLLSILNFRLIGYGISQLRGQLSIIRGAQPVEKFLSQPGIDSLQKARLHLISDIRRFAMDSLGLKDSKNYTSIYDQKDKPVMWVVTGCKLYELKAKEWWFPVIGHVAYKGFFNEPDAIREAEKVRAEGFETNIYSPSAWSTLGFFNDPILSNQLKRSEGRLADLLIHELTHATIYLKSSVDFNENLATFIGEKGAIKFLEYKYGNESSELKKYTGYIHDEEKYSVIMMEGAKSLDSLYSQFTSTTLIRDKALSKYKIIAQTMMRLNQADFYNKERYRFKFGKEPLPDNTEFMAFLRYRKSLGNLENLFNEKYSGNLKLFIKDIVQNPATLQSLRM